MSTFQEDIRNAINRGSRENGSDTPDFILAEYMLRCLDNFNTAVRAREKWYGRQCGFGEGFHFPLDDVKMGVPTDRIRKAGNAMHFELIKEYSPERAVLAAEWIRATAEPAPHVPLGAIMEAVAEGMAHAENENEDPMSWIQSCVSRIKGITDLTDDERLPSLKLKINEHKESPVRGRCNEGLAFRASSVRL